MIDEDEYKARKRSGYSPNDVVGKDGLENAYDRYLHGRAGGEQVEVNASGFLVRRLKPLDPVPGDTLVTTIDWRLQRIVEKNLRAELKVWGKARGQRLSGAAIVIDPKDGGMLALASLPEFDPNKFATPIDETNYSHLLSDKLNPLFDRAIGAASPTGSTFKMVTGSGAISSGVIKPNQVLYDSGSWFCHGVTFRDIASGGLGSTGFVRALAASSDGYFYQLGDRLGHTRLRYYATAVRPGREARRRPARRVPRQLADRGVDAAHLRQGLPSRAERRVPARDRPGRDASDAAADGQRHARPSSTAARSTARTSSRRSARRAAACSRRSTTR